MKNLVSWSEYRDVEQKQENGVYPELCVNAKPV